jgi:hypothetical protein
MRRKSALIGRAHEPSLKLKREAPPPASRLYLEATTVKLHHAHVYAAA